MGHMEGVLLRLAVLFLLLLPGTAAFADFSLYEKMASLSTSSEERQAACIALLENPDSINIDRLPALLDAVDLHPENRDLAMVIAAFFSGSTNFLSWKDPGYLQHVPPALKERIFKTFSRTVLDDSPKDKENAYSVIAFYGKGNPETEKYLLKRVEEEKTAWDKIQPIHALTYCGIKSPEGIRLLLVWLNTNDTMFSPSAAETATRLKLSEAIPSFISLLGSESEERRNMAVHSLERYGTAARKPLRDAMATLPAESPIKSSIDSLLKEPPSS